MAYGRVTSREGGVKLARGRGHLRADPGRRLGRVVCGPGRRARLERHRRPVALRRLRTRRHTVCQAKLLLQRSDASTVLITQLTYADMQLVLYRKMSSTLRSARHRSRGNKAYAAPGLRQPSKDRTQPCVQAQVRPAGHPGRLSLKSVQQRSPAHRAPCSTGRVLHNEH